MNTIASRLARYLELKNGGNQSELARYCGVSPQAVQKWISGDSEPRGGNLAKIADFLNVTPALLQYGEEYRREPGPESIKISPELAGRISDVPVHVGSEADQNRRETRNVFSSEDAQTVEIKRVKLKLSAGINRIQIEHCIEIGEPVSYTKEWLQRRGLFPEDLLALEVTGDSMSPGMQAGDVVVINTAEKVPKHNKIFAVNFDGQAVIKKMMFQNKNWFLYSDNPDQEQYPPHHCKSGECIPIGLVVDLRREF